MSLMPLGLLSQGGGNGSGGNALTLISSQVLTGSAASITFSGIAGTFKHLQIRVVSRSTSAGPADGMEMQFNSDSGANYTRHQLLGNGSTVTSAGVTGVSSTNSMGWAGAVGGAASNYAPIIIDILDYSNTNKNKTVRWLAGNADSAYNRIQLGSSLWLSTTAISSFNLFLGSGSFVAGSRFSLYGVS